MTHRFAGWALVIAASTMVVSGCQAGGSTDSTSPTPTASASDAVTPGLVDIGGGRQIFARCEGSGSPTVVFISGQGLTADGWRIAPNAEGTALAISDNAVFQTIAKRTRVCAYDRGAGDRFVSRGRRSLRH